MSLTVKKVTFGNTNQFFMKNNMALQQGGAQSSTQTVTGPQTIATPVPQVQYVSTVTPAPVYQPAATNGYKTLAYVSSGLAMAALGLTSVSAIRGRNAQKAAESYEKLEQKLVAKMEDKLATMEEKTTNLIDSVKNKVVKEISDREGLGKYFDGIIGDIDKKLGLVEKAANEKVEPIVVDRGAGFLSKVVTVNGKKMRLANTLHGYGKYTDSLNSALQSEAANRMLGFVDRSKMQPSDKITVRIPTSEFKGIASTGGMSIVPREVLANLGAFINNKQDVRLIVDMPMYLGEIEHNSKSGKQTFYALKALGNGKFNWVSKAIKGGNDSVVVGNLEKIASTRIPIYDDAAKTMQDVEVFMAKGLKQDVDYNLLKSYLEPDTLAVYNASIEKYMNDLKKFSQDTAPLRQKVEAEVEALEKMLKEKGGNISTEEKSSILKQIQDVKIPLDNLKKEFVKNNGNLWEEGFVSLTADAEGHIKAKISFDGVFYKNEKFDMKGPRFDGNDANKNIYNDKTINSGETERFLHFGKYFYEFLTKSPEHTNERLGADLIIGNDWQTGAISAMTRLLTKAKEAVGDLTPKDAEKLYNTPIATILHNAQLAGQTHHSSDKFFNILFGEHAAQIVENAHMPDVTKIASRIAENKGLQGDEAKAFVDNMVKEIGLPSKCWNGLMHGECVNPQTMATAYSDVIIPVSDKYMEEIATQGVYGRENFELFRLRKYASDHAADFANQKTIVGITNGCDKVNNMLTDEGARLLEKQLQLPKNSIKTYDGNGSILEWHNHNKKVILDRVIADVNNPKNPMKLELPDLTDLTGVDENTMIVSTAGRIVDQKGLDIFAGAIEDVLRNHKFENGNYPVFYAQGNGDEQFIKMLLAVKEKVARSPELGGQAAANRIVFANLFSEPGRYDACKLMSDFSIMSSWFEPCGLVHKEIVAKSGAIPIVNETGGLTSGLSHGVDAIFSKFKPAEPNKDAVRAENASNFSKAMWDAYEIFKDKAQLAKMMENSYNNDFSWLVENGPMAQYVKIFTDLKVLKPQVLS